MALTTKKRDEKVKAKVERAFLNGGIDKKVFPGAVVELDYQLFRELEAAGKVRRATDKDKNEPKEPVYKQFTLGKPADDGAEVAKLKADLKEAQAELKKAQAELKKTG